MINYTAVFNGQRRIGDLASDVTLDDLQIATNTQIAEMANWVRDSSDAQVVFVASDSTAEGGVGWNVAHLIAHVTASSEEGAAVSSILARGIDYPFEPRLRVEVDWTTLTTTAACLQRLEESRRIRQGYLERVAGSAAPRTPTVPCRQDLPERVGPIDANRGVPLGIVP